MVPAVNAVAQDPPKGFYLYRGTGMTAQDIAATAVSANGRSSVVETLTAMRIHGSPVGSRNDKSVILDLDEVDRILQQARVVDPSQALTPNSSMKVAAQNQLGASSDSPTSFPVYGNAINNSRTWSMKNMFIEVDWCNVSGCSMLDKVTATTMNTDPGTNGYKATATLLDWQTADYLTQVHFQSYLYINGQNYTVSDTCGSEQCVNTSSWDSGTKIWNVKSTAAPMKNLWTWQAHRFWGHHSQTGAWVWMVGRTTDAWCPFTATVTVCQY